MLGAKWKFGVTSHYPYGFKIYYFDRPYCSGSVKNQLFRLGSRIFLQKSWKIIKYSHHTLKIN